MLQLLKAIQWKRVPMSTHTHFLAQELGHVIVNQMIFLENCCSLPNLVLWFLRYGLSLLSVYTATSQVLSMIILSVSLSLETPLHPTQLAILPEQ